MMAMVMIVGGLFVVVMVMRFGLIWIVGWIAGGEVGPRLVRCADDEGGIEKIVPG
jgi:hypothetical protein